MKFLDIKAPALGLLALVGLSVVPTACKDNDPCDPGQESIDTGCFVVAAGGSAGGSSKPEAGTTSDGGASDGGAPSAGGAGDGAPVGNPDATFGTPCAVNTDCGGDAPICATDPLFYCSQIDCSAGEANDGACPEGWTCFPKASDHPSACVNLQ